MRYCLTKHSGKAAMLVACMLLALVATANAGPNDYGPFVIQKIQPGWSGGAGTHDGMSVFPPSHILPIAMATAAPCVFSDGFGIDDTDAAYKTKIAAIMAAFLAGKQVIIHQNPGVCSQGRNRIDGIEIIN